MALNGVIHTVDRLFEPASVMLPTMPLVDHALNAVQVLDGEPRAFKVLLGQRHPRRSSAHHRLCAKGGIATQRGRQPLRAATLRRVDRRQLVGARAAAAQLVARQRAPGRKGARRVLVG